MTNIQKIKFIINASLKERIDNLIELIIHLKFFIFINNYNQNKHYQYNVEVSSNIF